MPKLTINILPCMLLVCLMQIGTFAQSPGSASKNLWPMPDWQVADSPAEAGFSAAGLAAYRAWLNSRISSHPYGTIIISRGKIVFEQYGAGATAGSRWEIGSIRKSVASSLLGIAIHEGKLTLDTPVYQVWPEIYALTKQEEDKRILMRHLATATSGWKTPARPGEEWRYDNLAFTAGHAVVGRLYNLPDDKIAPLVERRIQNKIGARNWKVYHYSEDWHTTPGPKLAIDSDMRDLARYGYLWLRKGEWKGEQLVPAAYIAEASRNQVASYGQHYGYWWFTNDGRVRLPAAPADAYYHTGTGKGDRRTVLFVCPSLDLVAVIGHHKEAYDLTPSGANEVSGAATGVNEWISKIIAATEMKRKSF